ncbi:hypothetical protein PR003_g12282 [Phytophthora rubi]|uniref:Uncharacterized protein n=1 Tax=Phytophthora rubi TaxID=129364 RepID=A0A6A3LUC8_9STRA|nr:hypothetical protein PR002_g11869 [Phytophthora rubi]KAE9336876.1 hypothetical protein PR003_g12282 [Phytophthora rubi]
MSDSVFLAEVEDFLTSCDLPALLPLGDGNKYPDTKTSSDCRSDQMPRPGNEDKDALEDKNCKSYYRRRQMQRARLRRQVTELTEESNKRRKANEGIKLQLPSKWRAIAKYQEHERLNAEDTQRRLSSAVDTRAATIQEFWGLMQERLEAMGKVSEEEA